MRFVIAQKDGNSGRRQGLFQAISDLEHAGVLLPHEQEAYDALYEWFRHHLKKPRSLSRSRKPHAKAVALSWFKTSATEHISRMRQIADILHAHGVHTEMLRTDRPGYVVYEDAFQVAAEPYNDSGA